MTRIPIRPIGAYIQAVSSGTLPSSTATGLPQEPWGEPTEQLLQHYLAGWGTHIDSIYLRGSVARGLAIPDVSDLDSFAVLKPESTDIAHDGRFGSRAEVMARDITEQFPFVTGVEAELVPMGSALDRGNFYAFILKTEAKCIHGEHLGKQLKPFALNEANFQTRHFREHFNTFINEFPSEPIEQQPGFIIWIAKRYLRVGMEFVLRRENRYTRDLYLCYRSFAKHYPEQATSMHRTLELALNPENTNEVETFLYEFGAWLAGEADRRLTVAGYSNRIPEPD